MRCTIFHSNGTKTEIIINQEGIKLSYNGGRFISVSHDEFRAQMEAAEKAGKRVISEES